MTWAVLRVVVGIAVANGSAREGRDATLAPAELESFGVGVATSVLR